MTYPEPLLQVLSDAIKRATGADLNQTDVAAELDRIKAAYLPKPEVKAQASIGGAFLRPLGVPGLGLGAIPDNAEKLLACQ